MAQDYQQQDGNAACGTIVACSGSGLAVTPQSAPCAKGGTAGVTEETVSIAKSSTHGAVMFEFTPAAGSTWGAGNYTVNLNITTADTDFTWIATYVCRVNSSCVNQETIGSLTAQTTSLGTTGVKTHVVSGSAVTPSAGDKVYIVLVITNGNSHSTQSFGFTPNQVISTPITEPAATRRIFTVT